MEVDTAMKQLFPLAPLVLLAAGSTVPATGAPLPVQSYRAIGNEPFWGLTITDRQMTFDDLNGPAQVVQPTPAPVRGVAGETYQTSRLHVNVVHAQCSDGMSDRVYPDKVQVTADGSRFAGCGGPAVKPVILAVTEWTVTSVNGRPTPSSPGYYVNFTDNHVTAKFGCNRFNTTYNLTSDTLTAGPVAATRMACSDMSFESQASAILARPMRTNFLTNERMILANSAGKIEARRRFLN
jgi:heat shock protein HslJ